MSEEEKNDPLTDQNEEAQTEKPEEQDSEEEQQEPLDEQEELIHKLVDERDSLKDAWLRTNAEMQNIQRRGNQRLQEERKYAPEKLAKDLLPVLDNFARTIQAAEKAENIDALVEGVKAVEKQMLKAMESQNILPIEAEGKPFDPELHDAVVTYETEELPDDTVIEVLEAGYTLHDRVIRPAKVRVSKKP